MSTDVYFTVKRAGVALTNIAAFQVQIDTMTQAEASYYSGAAPYFRYHIYVRQRPYDIRQEDLLVDVFNIDNKTGTYKQYRIINDPELFFDNHTEIVADRVRGT